MIENKTELLMVKIITQKLFKQKCFSFAKGEIDKNLILNPCVVSYSREILPTP